MKPTTTRILARFVNALNYDDLPVEVIDKIKTLVLHGIGVGLAAFDTETAQVAIEMAKREGPGGASILIDGSKVIPPAAAFANAALFHSRAEEDDYMDGLMHPGVVIIPAVLAMSEVEGSSGKDLIAALAAGYEVAARVSRGFARISGPRGFRATPVYGPFGAAAAAAKLLNLNEDQIVRSLGWTANLSSGLLQCALAKTPEMPIQAGIAARNGIWAARLGQVGASVAEDMLEGERGLYFAFCGSANDTEKIVPGLGREYWMLDVIQKRFPIGGAMQSPIFSVLKLIQENDLKVENIEKIELWLAPPWAKYPGINSQHPGLISAQYCIAVACVHRSVTLRTVADMDNPRIRELMPRIILEPDEKINPPGCKLAVTLKDQQVLKKDMMIGYKDFSFSFAEEQKHVESLFPEMAVTQEGLTRMIALIRNMENLTSVPALIQTLSNPGRKGKRIKLPF